MKRFAFTILCCLAILSVSIVAVSASSSFLAEIVELADSYKGGGGGRGGGSGGGRGGSGGRSGGGRSGGQSGRGGARGGGRASGQSGKSGRAGKSGRSSNTGKSNKSTGMAGRMAGRTRAAGLKAAQARASLSKLANSISTKFSKVSPALSKAFSAVAPNMAKTISAMTAAVKSVNTIKGPRVNSITARLNAAFAAQPAVTGKLTASAIQASVQNKQAAAAAATTVSGYKIDKGLLTKNEAFSTKGYVPTDKKGTVVGKSGVTVGTGFDVGQQSVKGLKSLGLSPSLVDKLSPYAGLKQQKAVAALAKNPLSISAAEAKAIDKAVMDKSLASLAKDYEAAAAKNPNAVKNFKDLPSSVQSVAYSVQHQYGSLKKATPGFFGQLTKNDYKGMVNNLRDFKDAYSTRRNREADHLEKGLQASKG